jgi:hypothetical protein
MRSRLHRASLGALAAFALTSQALAADNLLTNGDFATKDETGWSLSVATGNDATADYATGAAVVSVTESDATNYGVQLVQKGLHLDAGTTYTVSFTGSISAARKIHVAFSTDKTWHYQGGSDVALTATPKTYTVKITPDSTVEAGILQFNLGGTAADITIDNVVVSGGSSTVTAGSEMIVNGDFATNDDSDWGLNLAASNTATAEFATGAAIVTVVASDATNYGIQLVQKDIAFENGATYTISFDASSTVARPLAVGVNETKFWKYRGGASFNLTTTKTTYTFKLTLDTSTAVGVLQFNLGGTAAVVTIDNVSMKKLTVSNPVVLLPDTSTIPDAPSNLPGLRVKGRFLYTPTGEKVIFRGVNEMFVWGDLQGASLPEIAKTGANAVRIAWKLDGGTAAGLDTLAARAIRNKLIPIVEFVDATGKWDSLPMVVNGWLSKPYLDVVKKHEKYLVLNIGNEIGESVGPSDYVAGYDSSVAKLRRAGVRAPLMIDASSWGQSYTIINQTAKTLLMHDSLHNILNSVHMWWPIKNHTDRAAVVAKIKAAIADAVAKNIPLVVGEFGEAFTPTDATAPVAPGDSIPFRTIMAECQANQIGWLAWSWGKVHNNPQVDLDMTPDGTFASLQTWGLEVAVTDPNSIKNTSVISKYVTDGVALGWDMVGVHGRAKSVDGFELRVGNGMANLVAPVAGTVEWMSVSGAVVGSARVQAGSNSIELPRKSGLWILRMSGTGREWKVLTP